MIIKPTAGLCNRLRVVFSYLIEAKENNQELIVIWNTDSDCPGFFLDYFEPVDGITFLKEVEESSLNVSYEGCYVHKTKQACYKNLKIQLYLKEIIEQKIQILEPYNAVHIRRTDHSNLAKRCDRYTSDDMFCNFIDKRLNKNLYLATDNKLTYEFFKSKYPKNIHFNYHQSTTKNKRNTSLKDSIIDLYMCVHAYEFMGSDYSSFSDTINNLRKINNSE